MHPRITAVKSDMKALRNATPELFAKHAGIASKRVIGVRTPELREFGEELWKALEVEEIARGGRYDGVGAAFGAARPATGFSADLNELLRLGAPGAASSPRTRKRR